MLDVSKIEKIGEAKMDTISNIPKFDEMMCEMFRAMKMLGGSGTIKEIDEKTVEILDLSQEIQDIPHKTGGKTEVEYRLAWTRTYLKNLKKVGILENSSRGIWALTVKGRELESVNPKEIVHQVRKAAKIKVEGQESVDDDLMDDDGVDIPDEVQSWRETLKNVLYNISPGAFERLTQRLLRESGFTQVKVTGKTGDGGIDGMGMELLVFKCYSNASDIQEVCRLVRLEISEAQCRVGQIRVYS